MEHVTPYVAVAAFALNFVATIIIGTWKLGQLQLAIGDKITHARSEIEDRQDSHLREFGETAAAIRQKVADVELYTANNFIRREGFYKVQEQLTGDIKTLGEKIETRLLRMEVKLDSKT